MTISSTLRKVARFLSLQFFCYCSSLSHAYIDTVCLSHLLFTYVTRLVLSFLLFSLKPPSAIHWLRQTTTTTTSEDAAGAEHHWSLSGRCEGRTLWLSSLGSPPKKQKHRLCWKDSTLMITERPLNRRHLKCISRIISSKIHFIYSNYIIIKFQK